MKSKKNMTIFQEDEEWYQLGISAIIRLLAGGQSIIAPL